MFKSLVRLFRPAPVAARATPRVRLSVEPLEDRAVPASWTASTVAELVQRINDATALTGPDIITLTAGATYTLTAVNNTTYGPNGLSDGPNGLPVITDSYGLTIVGQGATVERSTATGTPAFRLLE